VSDPQTADMLDLDRLRFCTNSACRRGIPQSARAGDPCPHCGHETVAGEFGDDGGALLPPSIFQAPPFWRDVGPVAWGTTGWVLFLLWLYRAYWGTSGTRRRSRRRGSS